MAGLALAVLALALNLWPWLAFLMFFVGISAGVYWFYNLTTAITTEVRIRREALAFVIGACLVFIPIHGHVSLTAALVLVGLGSCVIGGAMNARYERVKKRPRP